MLKTTRSSVASNSRVDDNEVIGDRSAISQSDASKKLTKSKNQTKIGNSNDSEEFKFLNSKAKEAFNRLRQAFTKALIFRHFDLQCYIRMETNASGYAIKRVLSQLIPNQLTLGEIKSSLIDIQWSISREKWLLLRLSTRLIMVSF